MVEVLYTDEFDEWWQGLTEGQQDDVAHVVELLEAKGVGLGYPYSSAVKGSTISLRELRIQSGGDPFRVFYVFDPKRRAVLLVGGSKVGKSKSRFYPALIAQAEAVYAEYLVETKLVGP